MLTRGEDVVDAVEGVDADAAQLPQGPAVVLRPAQKRHDHLGACVCVCVLVCLTTWVRVCVRVRV